MSLCISYLSRTHTDIAIDGFSIPITALSLMYRDFENRCSLSKIDWLRRNCLDRTICELIQMDCQRREITKISSK